MYVCHGPGSCDEQPWLKEQLGHDGPPAGFWTANLLTGETLKRCPIRDLLEAAPDVRRRVERWKALHRLWRDGQLLSAGGLEDQPAVYVEAMQELDALDVRSARKWKELHPKPDLGE